MKDFLSFPLAVQIIAVALASLFIVIIYIGIIKPIAIALMHWGKAIIHSETLRISDESSIKIDHAHSEADAMKHYEKAYNNKGLQID